MQNTPKVKSVENEGTNPALNLAWRVSAHMCALADGERHIGHAMKIGGKWQAWDATRGDASGRGFLNLGSFNTLEGAQRAIEYSYCLLPQSFAGAA